ncbi:MAG TPA: hypothetical protein VFA88_11510, partial [Gaiellaceae bacterium]|nr:hypothetical protein [Gaiellaceae bacterium]
PEPVDAAICLRSFYYPTDRRAFFARVRGYTRKKFVFDFRARVHDPATIAADLRAAGFERSAFHPFLLPQLRRVPPALVPAIDLLERTGAPARLVARRFGRVFCAAWVD